MIVKFSTNQGIDWNATGISRRLQNINNALNTFRYEVAYDRTFGRNPDNLDKPRDKYIQAVIAETFDLIPEIDPGAKVVSVNYKTTEAGEDFLEVVISIE